MRPGDECTRATGGGRTVPQQTTREARAAKGAVLTLSRRGQACRGVGQEWLMRTCPQLCVLDKSRFPGPCLGNYGVSDQLALHSETQLKHCESSQ